MLAICKQDRIQHISSISITAFTMIYNEFLSSYDTSYKNIINHQNIMCSGPIHIYIAKLFRLELLLKYKT